jgi:hypothetical protein
MRGRDEIGRWQEISRGEVYGGSLGGRRRDGDGWLV